MSWLVKLPRQQAGQTIVARTINRIAEAAEWACKITVSPPLEIICTGAGPHIRLAAKQGVFLCQPTGPVAGATGTWPTITPTKFGADIYLPSAGSLTAIGNADCYNWHAGGLVASKTCTLIQDPSGAYVVIDQDC